MAEGKSCRTLRAVLPKGMKLRGVKGNCVATVAKMVSLLCTWMIEQGLGLSVCR